MALPRRKYIRSNSLPVNKIPAQLQRSTEGNHDGSGGIERTQSLQTCREETAAVRMLPVVKIENMASSRIAPVVLWGATPPSHSITSVLVSQNEETIVTGSKEGQLCLWDLSRDKGNEVQVRNQFSKVIFHYFEKFPLKTKLNLLSSICTCSAFNNS